MSATAKTARRNTLPEVVDTSSSIQVSSRGEGPHVQRYVMVMEALGGSDEH